ncbi:hypothetical protein HXX76_012233 [Chlamydomonas incerta]|uniref:FAD-binding domain-containing protein n=1 Tax=Chlamydomonas incerta TaxID=51695 RepID=A0A835SSR1_CHLIN|nr:hypothetical protein HXX76_012233 [Chlamydomonas incerta]|eukprot:KAG2427579.1 hypothetical protein HXX76_012233 [Chlamydomonas incerta]
MVGFRRFRLRAALMEVAAASLGVTVHTGKRLESLDCGEVPVAAASSSGSSSVAGAAGAPAFLRFSDGSALEADLVVGCDGLRSRVRAAVRGVDEPPPRYTGCEVVFSVAAARQEDVLLWFASHRRPESRDAWGVLRPGSAELEAVQRELLEEYRDWRMVEALVSQEQAVTIKGGNKALEDAVTLVACLTRFKGDIAPALALYQQLRIPRSAAILKDSQTGGVVSNLDSTLAIAARNTLLRTIVAVCGTLPSGWMWGYDPAAEVAKAKLA